jgi:hypothetical protein
MSSWTCPVIIWYMGFLAEGSGGGGEGEGNWHKLCLDGIEGEEYDDEGLEEPISVSLQCIMRTFSPANEF